MQRNRFVLSTVLLVIASACGLPPQPTALASSSTVEIFRDAKAVQCGTNGVPPDDMKSALTSKGVAVFASCRADDGSIRMALCDSPAGQINVYEINANDLQKALDLGFAELSRLPRYKDKGFLCRKPKA